MRNIHLARYKVPASDQRHGRLFHVPGWGAVLYSSESPPAWDAFVPYLNATWFAGSRAEWDAAYRRGAHDALRALHNLVRDMPHMSVPREVAAKVRNATHLLDTDPRRAFELAEDAFYHPRLLPQLYFPEEHLLAVYAPLALPTLLPLMLGLVGNLRG